MSWIISRQERGRKWARVVIFIRKEATGEIVTYEHDELMLLSPGTQEEGWSDYVWCEGNFSCDCNRELFFERAKGNLDFDDEHCSDGRFSVNILNPATNKFIYKEF